MRPTYPSPPQQVILNSPVIQQGAYAAYQQGDRHRISSMNPGVLEGPNKPTHSLVAHLRLAGPSFPERPGAQRPTLHNRLL
jgi:hypothetical protein